MSTKGTDAIARLDRFIADLEKQLQDSRNMRGILAANPRLADALLATLAPPSLPPTESPPEETESEQDDQGQRRRDRGPGGPATREQYSRIVEFLRSIGNQWAKTGEIEDGSGLTRNQVINILYKTNRESFEGRKSPENARDKEWRLTVEILASGGEEAEMSK